MKIRFNNCFVKSAEIYLNLIKPFAVICLFKTVHNRSKGQRRTSDICRNVRISTNCRQSNMKINSNIKFTFDFNIRISFGYGIFCLLTVYGNVHITAPFGYSYAQNIRRIVIRSNLHFSVCSIILAYGNSSVSRFNFGRNILLDGQVRVFINRDYALKITEESVYIRRTAGAAENLNTLCNG